MSRIALTAFSGWNDAGEAATGVLEHLLEIWPSRPAGAVDAEAFIDFQVNRPEIRTTEEGLRVLDWPDTELRILQPPQGPEIVTVMGPEPSLHWKRFCDEVLEQLQVLDVSSVISLGALLADAPHSRPLPVSVGIEPGAAEKVDPVGQYEGPVGVPTILARRTTSAGLRTTSIWVQVPHYVAQNPSPKATLALLRAVQDSISAPIPMEELVEDAEAWERGVDDLARTDEDVADYVRRLERAQDAAELPEASGDAIAREFEKFLRRRDGE
ncbi:MULTISPECIES: PAC2 family protein [Brachybacterium]|uniref:PAC2 family protein n=1 Tax=Brachybacterium TaxID=43668 RepID=UPI0010CD3738|nr:MULTISPECIES: PAC2 family protein [Brachybacterium]MCW1805660.1 PAC2 family protein [Brachybacterium squillarum]QCR54023.1 carboxylate--amine ligase [Brachybacterium sp. SGAir0954]